MLEKSVRGRSSFKSFLAVAAAMLGLSAAATVSAQPFGAWLTLSGPTNGYVNVPSTPDLNPSGAITIEAWVAVSDANGTACSTIVGKNFQQAYWVGLCGHTLRSYIQGTSTQLNGGTLDSGWHHIAVVYDGFVHCHWIDGELAIAVPRSGSLPATPDPLRIGSDTRWSHTPAGAIDEVRLWNVARSQDQLREWINKPILSAQTGLVGVWSFDGGPGDSIGGHGGTVEGAGTGFLTFPVVLDCGPLGPTNHCIFNRFAVSVTWRTADGATGVGTPVDCANEGSAIFWFFDPSNWELLVKGVNACTPSFNHYWLFSAATTNVFYRLTVTDVRGGASKIYFNYPGPPAPAVTDTEAFATCP